MLNNKTNGNSNNDPNNISDTNNDSEPEVMREQPTTSHLLQVNKDETTSNQDKKQYITGSELGDSCYKMFPLTCYFHEILDKAVYNLGEPKFKCDKFAIPCIPCDFLLLSVICLPLFCTAKLGKY